jgi:hypothetical protein
MTVGQKNDEVAGLVAEVTELRNRALAQAKELAVMRWEIASLMRAHPMLGRVNEVKSFLKRRFPTQLDRAMRLRRRGR